MAEEDTTRDLSESNGDETKNLSEGEKLILQRLDRVELRLAALENKADTRPIWERALAEILEVKERLSNIENKLDVLNREMLQLKANDVRFDQRLSELERKPPVA